MIECKKCFKYYNPVISGGCSLCQDYSFHENILCDLLRSSQDTSNYIECYAHKPGFSVVGENKEIFEGIQDDNKLVLSARQKWLKAYALQQWKYDSDKIFSNLNFHVCLIAKKREKLFENIRDNLFETTAMFNKIGDRFGGKLSALCVGFDHIHLHAESPPDYSADEIAGRIIESLESAIKNKFAESFDDGKVIFESSYFIETIG